MANYEATRYDFDGANLTGIEGTATGTILPWSTVTPPSGFLECDGTAVSRSTYAALFAVVGTTYGIGDGSTTFNVPNLADNVAVGKSNNKALGTTGGANTVTPTGNVAGSTANATLTTAQLASHSHTFQTNSGGSQNVTYQNSGQSGSTNQGTANTVTVNSTGSGQGHSHNMSANFAGDANSVLQPYLTLIYIIKT
jgi:microcystin-dependent protein